MNRSSNIQFRGVPLLGILAILLAACSSVPRELDFGTSINADASPVWPLPPEAPRYRYFGELTGEQNFKPTKAAREAIGRRLLRVIAGVDHAADDRVVLQRPQSGVVDSLGRILVTDVSRQAIFVFDTVANRLDLWDLADWNSEFQAPIGIAIAPGGDILVADAEQRVVFRLTPQGEPVGRLGEGILERPTGIAVDLVNGRIYVADTRAQRVQVFDTNGALIRSIGTPGSGIGEFNAPTHLAFRAGHLYVTDTLNARVQVFDDEGRFVRTMGKRGLFVGNLTRPKGVAVDSEGHVYIVESFYDHLLVFDNDGRFLLPISAEGTQIGSFFLPAGVWTDKENRLFISDMFNGRVVVLEYLGGTREG